MNTVSIQGNALAARSVRRVVMAAVLAVGAACAMSAWAQPGGGHHGGGSGMGGHGMMMFAGSPERVGRVVDHLLDGLNATDAQRTQIKQIAQAAASDLKAQREAASGLRDRAMQTFAAPNVDAAAAESVRQQMLSQHDQGSRRMLQAMLDVARVLTPEQRARLGERFKQREAQMRERMQRHERERAPR
jgi:periplasmic protein CpxP/Spy